MSSTTRSTSVPVGYFVMSSATFNAGSSGDEIFTLSGTSNGENLYAYDNAFFNDLSNGAIMTFQDYGVTEYDALTDVGGGQRVDLRKVVLVSVAGGTITPDQYAGEDGARYVPLGTRRNTETPFVNSAIPSSVQLIGKYF